MLCQEKRNYFAKTKKLKPFADFILEFTFSKWPKLQVRVSIGLY